MRPSLRTITSIFLACAIGGASVFFAFYKLVKQENSYVFSGQESYSPPAVVAPAQEPIQKINENAPSPILKNTNTHNTLVPKPTADPQIEKTTILWDVPFTSQAPSSNWNEPYQNFCEEAAVLMAAFWAQNKRFVSKNQQEQELNAIKDWEIKTFGDYIDTDAQQTALILTDFFGLQNVTVHKDPTIDDLKTIIATGGVIIAPTAGRALHNPNFSGKGPLYHMLVIQGYNEATSEFITNDPGTRKGEKYTYSYQTIDKSIANWYNSQRTIRLDDRQIIAVYHNEI